MIIGHLNVRAFVVVVPEIPEKTAQIQAHFKQVGVEAENFHGISANLSGLETTHVYERDNPGSGWRIGAKPVATWMSFYMLWSAMQYMPEDYFMTLEYDAKFHHDWRYRTEKALQDVPPDFDLLLLGSCNCNPRGQNPPKKRVKGEVWDVRWPVCGHATIVAKKALKVMLETQRKVYAPLDISLMLHTFDHLKVYTVLPRICSQFDTFLQP